MTVYASEQAHSSVEKAVRLAGFGLSNLRLIETDAEFAMVPQKLEQAISADLDAGKLPSAVVATVGTTATVAVDPVEAIAQIAARHRLWLHVDAAMAGNAMLLPECRRLWQGVEATDSLVFNPHKWMGATFDCSAYFVRDPGHLVQVMSTHPSYLKTGQDAQVRTCSSATAVAVAGWCSRSSANAARSRPFFSTSGCRRPLRRWRQRAGVRRWSSFPGQTSQTTPPSANNSRDPPAACGAMS
jgi:glutamate/tyrosine decarboxylase-like PLP-dependent enzyme